jgi:hypothetical protein
MGAMIRQASFSGGELGPALQGRSDIGKYESALARCRNFIPTPQGPAVNRPGFELVAPAFASATYPNQATRLIPFVASDSQACVLELGHYTMRVVYDGGLVQVTDAAAWEIDTAYVVDQYVTCNGITYWCAVNAGVNVRPGTTAGASCWMARSDYVKTTPWTYAELARLKFAQSGDVLTICDGTRAPYDLTRLDWDNWTLAVVSFDRGTIYIQPGYEPRVMTEPLPTADATHAAREWAWKLTHVYDDGHGGLIESAPYTIAHRSVAVTGCTPDDITPGYNSARSYATGNKVRTSTAGTNTGKNTFQTSLHDDNQGHALTDATWWSAEQYADLLLPGTYPLYVDKPLTFDNLVTDNSSTNPTGRPVVGVRVYRGRGEVFGLVWATSFAAGSASPLFVDYGEEPDYSSPPPDGRNPFVATAGTEYPVAVAYFQQRKVYAGTNLRPAWMALSRTGDFNNFDRHFPGMDDDSIELTLASRKFEEVRSLLPGRRLLAMTASSAWPIGGAGNGDPLSRTSIDATAQGARGSTWLDSIEVDDGVALFVCSRGGHVRDILFQATQDGLTGQDLSVLAPHFFDGHSIVDWTYQALPYSVIWCARDDGALLSLTYVRDQQVWAWALHETSGAVQNVCAIPEGDNDALYLVVAIGTTDGAGGIIPPTHGGGVLAGSGSRLIYRMASRVVTDVSEGSFVDAAAIYDGLNEDDGCLLSLTAIEGGVWIGRSDGLTDELTTLEAGDQIVFGPDTATPLVVTLTAAPGYGGGATGTIPAGGTPEVTATADWAIRRKTIGGIRRAADYWINTDADQRVYLELISGASWAAGAPVYVKPWASSANVARGWRRGTIVLVGATSGSPSALRLTGDTSEATYRAPAIALDAIGGDYQGGAAEALADYGIQEALGGLLDHLLEGQVVSVLADGVVIPDLVVSAAKTIALPTPAQRVIVGLPYTSDLELLDVASEKTRNKNVVRAFWEVATPASISVGESLDSLTTCPVAGPVTGAWEDSPELVEVRTGSSWNKGGRAVLSNSDPVPVTVYGVSREVEGGGS